MSEYRRRHWNEYRDYILTRRKLKRICRPDKLKKRRYERLFPGLDASDQLFDNPEECDRILREMRIKLRKAFNRDSETGRRLRSHKERSHSLTGR